jgi:hypothetical protein
MRRTADSSLILRFGLQESKSWSFSVQTEEATMMKAHWCVISIAGLLLSPMTAVAQQAPATTPMAPVASQAPAASTTPAAPTAPVTPAAPATTTQAALPPGPPALAPGDDPNEIICKVGDPVVGTRLPSSRKCLTRKEWADLQYQSSKAVYQMQMMERAGNPPGAGK